MFKIHACAYDYTHQFHRHTRRRIFHMDHIMLNSVCLFNTFLYLKIHAG